MVTVDVADSRELSRVELGGEMELGVRSSGVGPGELLLADEDRPNERTRNENRLIAHAVHRGRGQPEMEVTTSPSPDVTATLEVPSSHESVTFGVVLCIYR